MLTFKQTKNLKEIFDLSDDYFTKRMGKELVEGIHYLVPPSSSKTKKAILWDINALINWMKGHQVDQELDELLSRAQKR
ncbi:hypothetical protein SJPD1_0950 [Sulfurospirillum diekertiae]|uniref:Uncharacterized protein n=1 Tax=Sulfurospirillum diekertiae TaxID=1854492 RepID=A0A290HBY3_9BACT|nr:hypothetical protein [Sulfurospirillum diekertiae]ATB69062.1 hypothetical protein SJPD1_0950 [Sulfurospirillum diekertiae]